MLTVSGLTICFPGSGGPLEPVRDFSLSLNRGETLGLVGPSGCGKTVFCTALIGLLERPGYIKKGIIRYRSLDLTALSEREWRHIRGKEISMIFQNPVQSLNHARTIGSQFIEAIRAHRPDMGKRECIALAEAMLEEAMLGEPKKIMAAYPFELSGGMCQRVMIAMALVHRPALLIADEPTTALDTKNQDRILRLFARIRETCHTAILLVSHDEKVIGEIAGRTVVMPSRQTAGISS
jgi:ABC-type dipeptide/oligopeptide/nickel transport system ATPase component